MTKNNPRRTAAQHSAARYSAALCAGALALALLSGCTASPVEPAPAEAAVVTLEPENPTIERGTVVATGEIIAVDGSVNGTVAVVKAVGQFDLTISGIQNSRADDIQAVLSARPVAADEGCWASGVSLILGSLSAADQTFGIPAGADSLGMGDPSFWENLVLTQNTADNACPTRVVGVAALTWTLPDMRPALSVVDSGSTGGANGEVTKDGADVVSYTVAHGDVLKDIAARFGITVNDLHYLNPARLALGNSDIAYADETLNLSKSLR